MYRLPFSIRFQDGVHSFRTKLAFTSWNYVVWNRRISEKSSLERRSLQNCSIRLVLQRKLLVTFFLRDRIIKRSPWELNCMKRYGAIPSDSVLRHARWIILKWPNSAYGPFSEPVLGQQPTQFDSLIVVSLSLITTALRRRLVCPCICYPVSRSHPVCDTNYRYNQLPFVSFDMKPTLVSLQQLPSSVLTLSLAKSLESITSFARITRGKFEMLNWTFGPVQSSTMGSFLQTNGCRFCANTSLK